MHSVYYVRRPRLNSKITTLKFIDGVDLGALRCCFVSSCFELSLLVSLGGGRDWLGNRSCKDVDVGLVCRRFAASLLFNLAVLSCICLARCLGFVYKRTLALSCCKGALLIAIR